MLAISACAEFEEKLSGGFKHTNATTFVVDDYHSALLVHRDTFGSHKLAMTEFGNKFAVR